LTLICFPAAAEGREQRSGLSVTAIVQPACRVSADDVRCSSGTRWTSASAARQTARPLAAAATVLGEPLRLDGRIVLVPIAIETVEAAAGASYRTITY
jgi:hypothetical protein